MSTSIKNTTFTSPRINKPSTTVQSTTVQTPTVKTNPVDQHDDPGFVVPKDEPAEAASVEPAKRASQRKRKALAVDGDTIKTSGGYTFENEASGFRLKTPARDDGQSDSIHFDFSKNTITESDGTQCVIGEGAKSGAATYNLADGTKFRLRSDGEGKVTGYDVVSSDSHAIVKSNDGNEETEIKMKNDGRQWRVRDAENRDPKATQIHVVGLGGQAQQIGEHQKQIGLYAIRNDGARGWLEQARDKDGKIMEGYGNMAVDGPIPAVTANQLLPKLGTPGYQHALENQMYDQIGTLSGHLQQGGLGFGGLGGHFSSMPSAMQSVMLMMQLLGQQDQLRTQNQSWDPLWA